MIRSLKSRHVLPRLFPFHFGKSGSTFTDNYPGKFYSFADGGNGISTLTPRDPGLSPDGATSPIIIASPVGTVSRHLALLDQANKNIRVGTLSNVGVATDMSAMGLAFGQDTRFRHSVQVLTHSVMSQYPNSILSAMKVDYAGGDNINLQGATLTEVAPGEVTITFPRSAAYNLIAVAIPVSATESVKATVKATTKNSITVLTFDDADVAATLPFNLIYFRIDSLAPVRGRRVVKTNQVASILLFGRVVYNAGVPSWAANAPGGQFGALTDTGTGDLLITIPKAYEGARGGVAFACAGNNGTSFCTVAGDAKREVRVRTWEIGEESVAQDPQHIDIVVFLYENQGNYGG